MAARKKNTQKHNTVVRIRNDTADALDLVQWETGKAKSAVMAAAVELWIRRREKRIADGKMKRLMNSMRVGPPPKSRLIAAIRAESDESEKKDDS